MAKTKIDLEDKCRKCDMSKNVLTVRVIINEDELRSTIARVIQGAIVKNDDLRRIIKKYV